MNPSRILCDNGPLRLKTQTNGVPRLQGVFTMRDQNGFPLDMAYELAKERGWEIDWVEALADAARQSVLKYDALVAELNILEPSKARSAVFIFADGLMSCDGETFCEKAANLHRAMKGAQQ